MGRYNSPPLKKISSSKLPSLNNYGYCCRIVSSLSHVVSSVLWSFHNTLTNIIRLFRNSFTSRAKISTGSSLYVKFGLSSIVFEETTCDGSDLYLCSIDTWNTLWIFFNYGGKANLYATGPTFSITSNGPINLGLAELAIFPKSHYFLPRRYLQKYFSSISYRLSFLFMSAYDFCLSVATFNFSLIIFTFSSVS